MNVPENIKRLMQSLIDKDYEVYIVGGAVRDHLLGITPHDYDLFTNATGEQILEVFPEGKVIGGEERQKKILTVVVDGVEISQFRKSGDRTETGTTLQEHCATCDFTINAMAYDLKHCEILDFHHGMHDITTKGLWFVGHAEDRIKEDPLRIFRGIRFAAKYKMRIVDNTDFVCFKDYVQDLPKERIREEFMKILAIDDGLNMLNVFNMLDWILPEWEQCKHLNGGHHHNEELGIHMLTAVNNARQYTNNPLLLLAVFLHDIGKPESSMIKKSIERFENIDDTITFYNHHVIGAEIAENWMRTLKFSEAEIKYVTTMVRHHMMGKTGEMKQSTFTKICDDLNKAGVAPEDMLTLTFSDNQANLKNPKLTYNEFLKANGFYQRYYETKYKQRAFNVNDLDIDGLTIAKVLEIEPGPVIGYAKNALFVAVCEALIINRKDKLIEFLKDKRGMFYGK
jgi:tRNA nucleotidyltransferase (CCA-adding enzyme)